MTVWDIQTDGTYGSPLMADFLYLRPLPTLLSTATTEVKGYGWKEVFANLERDYMRRRSVWNAIHRQVTRHIEEQRITAFPWFY